MYPGKDQKKEGNNHGRKTNMCPVGKDAIGVQSFGCRCAYVCEDHAYNLLSVSNPVKHIHPVNADSNVSVQSDRLIIFLNDGGNHGEGK